MKKEHLLEISSNTKSLVQVEEFIQDLTSQVDIDNDILHSLLISVTEAVNNAIIHGNKRDPQKSVKILCSIDENEMEVRIKDQGEGFDINKIPNPLLPENLTKDSGRGIFIIRSLIDDMKINILPDGTEIILKVVFNKSN